MATPEKEMVMTSRVAHILDDAELDEGTSTKATTLWYPIGLGTLCFAAGALSVFLLLASECASENYLFKSDGVQYQCTKVNQ